MDHRLSPPEYRLLVEHSPVMIWRSGLDAKCDYFNAPWLQFTGRTMQQELGDGWVQGVHAEDVDRCVAHYLEHFQRRVPFEMEYRLRRHDGVYRWIFDRGAPYSDEAGAFAGFVGSCIDVHERHETQLAEQQDKLHELKLARDFEKWILAIVSHDIRDPLNVIHLSAHVLASAANDGSAAKKHADLVTRAVGRIRHIVGDLLDLERVRGGAGISLSPQDLDIRELCLLVADDLKTMAADRDIAFDCDAEGAGSWDEHRLLQAISNLTTNAIKHGKPGTPVHLRLTGDEQRVTVEIRNEGAVPPDVLPRMFEPFRSGRRHGRSGDGLGLGLFIAKAIAQAHGGELEMHSADDVTTFRLILPRRCVATRR